MNVICVLGSPRSNGNSAAIAKGFRETAEEMGATVKSYALNDLDYRGCQACMACKTGREDCAVRDDLTAVLDDIRKADVVLLASPIYYGGVSGQLKLFVDRTFCFLKPDFHQNPRPSRLAAGKKAVFVLTQGHPDEQMFSDVFEKYDEFFKWLGFEERRLVRACGVSEPGEVTGRQDVMDKAARTARELIG
jgi:multimeric flavodoxin WrbA